MEKLIIEQDDQPPSAGWNSSDEELCSSFKTFLFRILNRKYKRFFYHIKR